MANHDEPEIGSNWTSPSRIFGLISMILIGLILFMRLLSPSTGQSSPVTAAQISGGRAAPGVRLWNVGYLEEVVMRIDETKHYQLFSPEGVQEIKNLMPPSGHLVRDIEGKLSTVALFHQLKCLNIIRENLVSKIPGATGDSKRCLNYLRNTVLCNSNTHLESVFHPSNMTVNSLAVSPHDYRCRDWEKVYREAANQPK